MGCLCCHQRCSDPPKTVRLKFLFSWPVSVHRSTAPGPESLTLWNKESRTWRHPACTVFPPGFPNCVGGTRHQAPTRHSHPCRRQQQLMLGRAVTGPADLSRPHCRPGAGSSKIVLRAGELGVGGGWCCHKACHFPDLFPRVG